MEDNKIKDISVLDNKGNQSSHILPESVEAMIKGNNEKIGQLVDISDLEKKELNPFYRFRDYVFSIVGFTKVDPMIYAEMTDTIIKLRQVLENKDDFTILKKVPKSGTSDIYDLSSKEAL